MISPQTIRSALAAALVAVVVTTPAVRAADTVMREAIPAPVERGDLEPLMSTDGSGLPMELWNGLDLAGVETLIKDLEIPPRSPALHQLWKRLITARNAAPGTVGDAGFTALRLEALYRSGLASDAADELRQQPAIADPLTGFLASRNELANADTARACDLAREMATLKGALPAHLQGQSILIAGYCAAVAGDAAGAGLAAELAREEGVERTPGLDALDAISIKAAPKPAKVKSLSLLDYRLLELAGAAPQPATIATFEPALLVALANDAKSPRALRLVAAEHAARINALPPAGLAAIYSATSIKESPETLAGEGEATGALRRAALFQAAEAERTPLKKTRIIRALLDDGKRAGLSVHAMQLVCKTAAVITPAQELVWFAETGAEIGLACSNLEMTRRWAQLAEPAAGAAGSLDHWLALADIADPSSGAQGQHLGTLEAQALRGRFTNDSLHRLATVLDALGYQVPIPLWEAASRTPQPTGGHLPPTGVLSTLQDAAKNKQFGRTVLLAMKSLGPDGAEGANIIALGDSIRALKRAGLDADARRLGLEALLGSWPRTAVN
ncbi:MAG: hypothetical protein ACRCS9_10790 [Hyphomicrobium sp.]